MDREKMYIKSLVSAQSIENGDDGNVEKYMTEQALHRLGIAYAEKYTKIKIGYKYVDYHGNTMVCDEQYDRKYWTFIGKELTFEL